MYTYEAKITRSYEDEGTYMFKRQSLRFILVYSQEVIEVVLSPHLILFKISAIYIEKNGIVNQSSWVEVGRGRIL